MNLNQKLEYLLNSPRFLRFAVQACQQHGVPVNPGEDARAVMLLGIHRNNPQLLPSVVERLHEADRFEVQREPQQTQQMAALQKVAKDLPPAKVAALWKEAVEKGVFRNTNPGFEKTMGEALSRLGWAPLPGMTPGTTVLAYLNAINALPHVREREGLFEDLAAATGGAFGDADALRQSATWVRDEHDRDDERRGNDEMTAALVERGRDKEARLAKLNGRPLKQTVNETDPNAPGGGATRRALADAMAIEKVKSGPKRKVVVTTKQQLHKEMMLHKLNGTSPVGSVELSAQMRSDPTTADVLDSWNDDFAQTSGTDSGTQAARDGET